MTNKFSILFLLTCLYHLAAFGQNIEFIENKGQFHLPGSAEAVEYCYDKGSTRIYFTKTGLTYSFLKAWQKQEEEGLAAEPKKAIVS